MSEFTFSSKTGRYRDTATGRFVSDARLREGVDAAVDRSARLMGDAAARLRQDTISIEQFQAEMFAAVKDVHAASAMAAYGGRLQMSDARWGEVGARVRSEYGYVRNMVSQIIDGTQPLNGRFEARARSYASAGRITFETIQAREAAGRGYTEERNQIHSGESCRQCQGLAARGWVALGSLPLVGNRTCKQNCRCSIARRGARQQSEAA